MVFEQELGNINHKLERILQLELKIDLILRFLEGKMTMADFTAANAALAALQASNAAQAPVVQAAVTFIQNAESADQPQVDALTSGMTSAKASVDAATQALSAALNPQGKPAS